MPAGTQVALDVHLNSLAGARSVRTDGRFEASAVVPDDRAHDGRLFLNANGATNLTAFFTPEPQVPAAPAAAAAAVHPGLTSPEWRALVRESKFGEMPGFGRSAGGHLALQDHGDRVAFRNIKVREL